MKTAVPVFLLLLLFGATAADGAQGNEKKPNH